MQPWRWLRKLDRPGGFRVWTADDREVRHLLAQEWPGGGPLFRICPVPASLRRLRSM